MGFVLFAFPKGRIKPKKKIIPNPWNEPCNMGKNKKKGPSANVFKVAGAKSLKKTKAKPVNLGLKNIKQKVQEIDKEFVEINKKPKSNSKPATVVPPAKKSQRNISKEEVTKAAEEITKMDL